MSASVLKDFVGCTYKTAWYLGHRIRRMMGAGNAVLTDRWLHGDSTVMTDEFGAYDRLGKFYKRHLRVHHGADEFVSGDAHVNTAESFNATLKRASVGVYHYMSPKHLLRYVE